MTISRDDKLSLALQQIEEEEVQNLENKEQMIMRDGEFATMMQHQEEGEVQKSMEKEKQFMTSTPTGKDLLLLSMSFHCTIFFSIPHPRTWASPQKEQPWKWTVCFSSRIVYSIYKRYLESP